jgi:hypothetical protein
MTFSFLVSYITFYTQPLIGLLIGLVILAFVGYVNWCGTVKADTVRWVARYIFCNQFRSEQSADGLFMVVTSFVLAIGGMWVVLALLYLVH